MTTLQGVDTNLILALDALLRHQSVTRAAREMGVTQSTMSHALARLRSHFDDPLLVQVGRTLTLTERARSLMTAVFEARAGLERVFAIAEPFVAAESRRTFRIAATDNLELYVLPQLVAQLGARAPHVDLRIVPLPADWVLALQRGDIDLKLGRSAAAPSSVHAQELSRESFSCVVRAGHRCTSTPTLRELSELGFLVAAPSAPHEPTGRVDAMLAKHGLKRRVVVTVPHFLVAPFIVADSELAWIAPTRLVEFFKPLLPLREITLPFAAGSYGLSQVWAARRHEERAIAWLRGEVLSALRGRPAASQAKEPARGHNRTTRRPRNAARPRPS